MRSEMNTMPPSAYNKYVHRYQTLGRALAVQRRLLLPNKEMPVFWDNYLPSRLKNIDYRVACSKRPSVQTEYSSYSGSCNATNYEYSNEKKVRSLSAPAEMIL